MSHSLLSLYAYRLFIAGLFILPFGIAISAFVPLMGVKIGVIVVTVGLAVILGLAAGLRGGKLSLPLNWVMLSVWLVPLAYLLSTLVSPSWQVSMIGQNVDTDTFAFMVLLALTLTLPLYLFQSKTDTMRAFFALLISAWVVALIHALRLIFGADVLSFGIFTSPLFSLLGKWNDLAIFFGLTGVLSLITLEALTLERLHTTVLQVTLGVSLFFVALVNFVPVWVAFGLVALGIVLYRIFLAGAGQKRYSVGAVIVLVVAVLWLVFATSLGAMLSGYFGTSQIEARPSLGSTGAVAMEVLKTSPILGSGPNTFLQQWDKYRPVDLNQTVFWNADFTSGVGMVPTSLVTTGILGLIAWVVFIGLFLWAGVRALLLAPTTDPYGYHLMLTSFAGGAFILLMAIVYLPSPALLAIGFACVGMFAALYHRERMGRTIEIVFAQSARLGFVAVLALVLLIIAAGVGLFQVGSVLAANVSFERASYTARTTGDIESATASLANAQALSSQDRFYRLGALLDLAKLNAVVAAADERGVEESQKDFQEALGSAVENGLAAVRTNQVDYRNWQALGSSYHSVVALKLAGAYEAAQTAYNKAGELNPKTPTVPFALAQLEVSNEELDAARPFVQAALDLKQDYIPALLLLAQIELTQGNLDEAILRSESAAVFEPSNPITRFQVGVLKFEKKDYAGAKTAFAEAIALAPDYSNAYYYMGRVNLVQNDREAALTAFEKVLELNPDNADVKDVIASIKAGGDPFAPAAEAE